MFDSSVSSLSPDGELLNSIFLALSTLLICSLILLKVEVLPSVSVSEDGNLSRTSLSCEALSVYLGSMGKNIFASEKRPFPFFTIADYLLIELLLSIPWLLDCSIYICYKS